MGFSGFAFDMIYKLKQNSAGLRSMRRKFENHDKLEAMENRKRISSGKGVAHHAIRVRKISQQHMREIKQHIREDAHRENRLRVRRFVISILIAGGIVWVLLYAFGFFYDWWSTWWKEY